ncbi:hypothetical protein [Amycolatopsis sp. NPDC051716]|jgi:hypothetical protein|uniref:hypothetical protein n=1 Tax=Amycolatopsis sp. NPDC051716 TaxID=3155804 RepID=UPI003424CD3F
MHARRTPSWHRTARDFAEEVVQLRCRLARRAQRKINQLRPVHHDSARSLIQPSEEFKALVEFSVLESLVYAASTRPKFDGSRRSSPT